ncbi:glycine zipper domain-containing protein [Dyella sedimenti]|uniref:glycine zipper domain-containing protein n=1 Tax=Dyella sedimenti TaxID=2919947 RepID=UPI001FAA7B46|nr:glycine zipper domain-containing protein [Dyella sedimenti]
MSGNSHRYRHIGVLVGSAVLSLVAGCAQMPAQNGTTNGAVVNPDASAKTSSECNPALAGAVGALAGAFFGKGNGHLVGAAVGAGIGALACTAYNYHSRKVRDASAVETAYVQQRGSLPATNTISSYSSSLAPSNTVQSGNPVELQSTIVVVHGTHDAPPQLSETLTLFSPDGKQLSTVTKQASDINGTGEYQTNFNFNLPKGIQNGRYVVRSTLSMNNQAVETNETPMLVVS